MIYFILTWSSLGFDPLLKVSQTFQGAVVFGALVLICTAHDPILLGSALMWKFVALIEMS